MSQLNEGLVLDALRQIKDPDLHKDIVTLGFIKDLKIAGGAVSFRIVLTTPACPVREEMESSARELVSAIPGVTAVNVTMDAEVPKGRGLGDKVSVPGVKNIVAVSSGKGGVGKSTLCILLYEAMRRAGHAILIKDWDFNWQGDYCYANPILLPKGTTLVMHWTYDNSSENERNPNQPPKRVRYGSQTTDEMGELWYQVLPRYASERNLFEQDFYGHLGRLVIDYNESVLKENPNDAEAHTKAGRAKFYFGRVAEALSHFQAAIRADPNYDKAHYELGFIYQRQNKLAVVRYDFIDSLIEEYDKLLNNYKELDNGEREEKLRELIAGWNAEADVYGPYRMFFLFTAISALISRLRLGLRSSKSSISSLASMIEFSHPLRGLRAGEFSSFSRWRMIRLIWLPKADFCEMPKPSISSARFSQSNSWFEPLRATARRASTCCCDHATKSSS